LRAFRSFHSREKLIVNILDWDADQRSRCFVVSCLNGLAGRLLSKDPVHAPMLIITSLGLQRADIGQFFKERWQSAQCASFEIILGVEDHIHSLVRSLPGGARLFRNIPSEKLARHSRDFNLFEFCSIFRNWESMRLATNLIKGC
jgi:hypothetical protein